MNILKGCWGLVGDILYHYLNINHPPSNLALTLNPEGVCANTEN